MDPLTEATGLNFDPVTVDDDEFITGGVLIAQTIDADGDVGFQLRYDGVSFTERIGMLEAALVLERERLAQQIRGAPDA